MQIANTGKILKNLVSTRLKLLQKYLFDNKLLILVGFTFFLFVLSLDILSNNINPDPNTSKFTIVQDGINVDSVLIWNYSDLKIINSQNNKDLNEYGALILNFRPKFSLLLVTFSLIFSISISLSIIILFYILNVVKKYKISIWYLVLRIALSFSVVGIYVHLPYSTPYLTSFTNFVRETNLFFKDANVIIGMVIPLFFLMGVGCLGLLNLCSILNIEDIETTGPNEIIERYIDSKRSSFLLLGILGYFVSSVIVIASWLFGEVLRESIISENQNRFDIFPYETMLIQAIVFTTLLILIYLPVFYLQHKLKSKIFSLYNEFDLKSPEKWEKQHKILLQKLNSGNFFFQNFGASIPLISPLLVYFLTKLIG